ncbi:MAG TPA: MFS transporter [Candidatus Eisenbacteria bacterium]|nr:MFS transporter [Candidatus Eisenbacteria bacterium]
MNRYLQLLRKREFALLWGGATVSALGDGMSFVALVWLVIERGGTSADVGWLAAVYTAPVVIGGLAAGVILDRFDPRRVLAVDNAIRGLAVASVPVAAALGVLTTAQLFVVAAIFGLLFMTSAAGIPTLIPRLVEREDLTTANAMESLSYGIAGLVGPTVAGLVIAGLGAPIVLALDAATYGIFVIFLLAMRRERAPGTVESEAAPAEPTVVPVEPLGPIEPGAVAAEPGVAPVAARSGGGLGPALRFVLGAPAILAITVMYMTLNISGGIMAVLAPIYARDVLGGGATTYGLLLSALTAGELFGLLVIGAISWRWPLGRSIAGAIVISALISSLLLFRPALLPMLVILAAWGISESSLTPWAQTIRMRLIPPELRGRVFALLRTLMQSTRPLGAIVAGYLLSNGDVTPALVAIVLLLGIPGVIGLWLPALGRGPTAEPA